MASASVSARPSLQREYQVGEHKLHNLQAEAAQLRDTCCALDSRIEGAIQVIRELLNSDVAAREAIRTESAGPTGRLRPSVATPRAIPPCIRS